jgi:uracil-DNA glycosylase
VDIGGFIDHLRGLPPLPDVANPWSCHVEGIDAEGAAARRRAHLAAFLAARAGARLVLVAEAPGYQGARFSGVPMTSERMLPQVLPDGRRTSLPDACRNAAERSAGFAEPTATVVWQALAEAGLARATVLWNAFPLHPHLAGRPLSNRRPTGAELDAMAGVLPYLLGLFPGARVVAVGTVARDRLAAMGVQAVAVRHPANGGVRRA